MKKTSCTLCAIVAIFIREPQALVSILKNAGNTIANIHSNAAAQEIAKGDKPACLGGKIEFIPGSYKRECNSQTLHSPKVVKINEIRLETIDASEEEALSIAFRAGSYEITESQASGLKKFFRKADSLVKQRFPGQRATFFLKGSADIVGNDLNETLSPQTCYKNIFVYLPKQNSNNKYETKVVPYPINNRVTNSKLANLRARSVQCWAAYEFPLIETQILHGGIEPVADERFRNVKIRFAVEEKQEYNPERMFEY